MEYAVISVLFENRKCSIHRCDGSGALSGHYIPVH